MEYSLVYIANHMWEMLEFQERNIPSRYAQDMPCTDATAPEGANGQHKKYERPSSTGLSKKPAHDGPSVVISAWIFSVCCYPSTHLLALQDFTRLYSRAEARVYGPEKSSGGRLCNRDVVG